MKYFKILIFLGSANVMSLKAIVPAEKTSKTMEGIGASSSSAEPMSFTATEFVAFSVLVMEIGSRSVLLGPHENSDFSVAKPLGVDKGFGPKMNRW